MFIGVPGNLIPLRRPYIKWGKCSWFLFWGFVYSCGCGEFKKKGIKTGTFSKDGYALLLMDAHFFPCDYLIASKTADLSSREKEAVRLVDPSYHHRVKPLVVTPPPCSTWLYSPYNFLREKKFRKRFGQMNNLPLFWKPTLYNPSRCSSKYNGFFTGPLFLCKEKIMSTFLHNTI